jgi:hypothetical protein
MFAVVPFSLCILDLFLRAGVLGRRDYMRIVDVAVQFRTR